MMGLINFLNPKLQPSVYCDAVCAEGFSAQNLITDDPDKLGFVGFTVTKPPAEIIFNFPKNIDLKVIKLWNSYRHFRSTAFEIYSKNEGTWVRVGYVHNLDKIDSVTFCYRNDFCSQSLWQHNANAFFFKTAGLILSNTSTIKIVIRATMKCPPILKKVEIWGLPSQMIQKADRELLTTMWNKTQNPNCQISEILQNNERHTVSELIEHNNLKIPEEFLDSITWELMVFPMVLPCGKVVDQSTIDKHTKLESKWGRMPSDPFTNLEFNSQRKAILNIALKARIEKFLIKNSDHFKTVPRCLGSLCIRRHKYVPQLIQHYGTNSAGTFSSLLLQTRRSIEFTSSTSGINDTPLSVSDAIQISKRIKLDEQSSTKEMTAIAPTPEFLTLRKKNYISTKNIDVALKAALQKITRYTCPLPDKILNSCIRCKSTEYEYEIRTCRHLVCRKCIVLLTKTKLCKCNLDFSTSDVGRYHKI